MITPVEVISKTRDGIALTEQEIHSFISGLQDGRVEHNQAAAWLMAVRLKGLDKQQTVWLTQAMIDSGETVDLSTVDGVPVDKHSTGGVGDTTTLVLVPIVAAAGGKVAKMSGRGLGHTGGTLDKMEAAGLRVDLSSKEFLDQVNRIGAAVISQTATLVPADGLLYSLRDVTATVDSVPLIASSVMSKKLACGAQAIVLDVKYGDGAFMPCLDSARELAKLMVEIGQGLGRRVKAALTSMEQPLGSAVGNALEFREAIEVVTGRKDGTRLANVSRQLAAEMLVVTGICAGTAEARRRVDEILGSGQAADKLKQLIEAQKGDPNIVDNPDLLPQAPIRYQVRSDRAGYLKSLAARQLGIAGLKLGAGRLKKSDPIDPAVGLILQKQVGERLEVGEVLCEIHAASEESAQAAAREVLQAASFSPDPVHPDPEIAEWVE